MRKYAISLENDYIVAEVQSIQKFKMVKDIWFEEKIIQMPISKNEPIELLKDKIFSIVEKHRYAFFNNIETKESNFGIGYFINIVILEKVEDDETIQELYHQLYQYQDKTRDEINEINVIN